MPKRIDLTNNTFGRLQVKCLDPDLRKDKLLRWRCTCECGKSVSVRGDSLRNGNTRSCGCLQPEAVREYGLKNIRHGYAAAGKGRPEYRAWASMRNRCSNKAHPAFRNYGKRGITVCARWNSFERFLEDMGPKPSPQHTLERKNNAQGYSPRNCCWATRKEQQRNRRVCRYIEFNGTRKTVAEWAEDLGISRSRLRDRIKRGMPLARALSKEDLRKK